MINNFNPNGLVKPGAVGDALLNATVNASQRPVTFNPGIKDTGAPVTFSPKSQATMNSVFGMPVQGQYDRVMSSPQNPPVGVQTPIVPPYDLTY